MHKNSQAETTAFGSVQQETEEAFYAHKQKYLTWSLDISKKRNSI